MIREVEGDILLTDAEAIAHGVAPHDHFQNGLALALRELRRHLGTELRFVIAELMQHHAFAVP